MHYQLQFVNERTDETFWFVRHGETVVTKGHPQGIKLIAETTQKQGLGFRFESLGEAIKAWLESGRPGGWKAVDETGKIYDL